MFHFPAAGPQPTWKRPVYLATTIVLWMLLGVFVQIILLVFVDRDEQSSTFSITTWWRLALVIAFGILGYFIGRLWWRLVYVERRWGEKPTPPQPSIN